MAADLSGNGYTDLVTANRTSGDLTVLWGLTGGGFAPETIDYGGHAPSALAVGDFTGDGRIDLAVADEEDDQVSVLLNIGGGAFSVDWSFDIGEPADFLQVLYSPDGYDGVVLAPISADSQNCIALLLAGDGSVSSTLRSRWEPSLSVRPLANSPMTASRILPW